MPAYRKPTKLLALAAALGHLAARGGAAIHQCQVEAEPRSLLDKCSLGRAGRTSYVRDQLLAQLTH